MSATDDLVPMLKKLRLSGVLQSLELRTRQAVEDGLSHPEFLYRLLHDEVERREGKQLDLRVRRAGFEQPTTLEDFDFHFNPTIPRSRVIDLATCAFVERRENVLLVGKTGVGKTHLAQAFGLRACRLGYDVLFVSAPDLFRRNRCTSPVLDAAAFGRQDVPCDGASAISRSPSRLPPRSARGWRSDRTPWRAGRRRGTRELPSTSAG